MLTFGGCFDKVPGIEYEDCYFTLRQTSPELLAWLDDARDGGNNRRNLQVYQFDELFNAVARMDIQNAFLREFRISDALAGGSGKESLTFSIVVVPGLVDVDYSNSSNPPGGGKSPPILSNNFRFDIDSVDEEGIGSVTGMRMWWPKLDRTLGHAIRREFMPGAMAVDNITITVSTGGGHQTAQHLDQWMQQTAQGNASPRNAALTFFNLASPPQVVLEINMTGLVPLQFLPFGTGPADADPRGGISWFPHDDNSAGIVHCPVTQMVAGAGSIRTGDAPPTGDRSHFLTRRPSCEGRV